MAAAEQQLRSRDQQLHFNSDSENEEFLNTIETQRLQLLALEDSLRQEKDNFAQLQRVLQVERGRGRREAELGGAQLDQALAREKQKYSDLHAEYELLKRARYGQQHSLGAQIFWVNVKYFFTQINNSNIFAKMMTIIDTYLLAAKIFLVSKC